jgi:hypothetical protein
VMLESACRKAPVPALARWLLGVGVVATLAANVAHVLGHGLTAPQWLRGPPSRSSAPTSSS